MGLWHSLSQQWSHILRLCFGIERSTFCCSSISTAKPDWGACITARRGSALWQFTLFSYYYDGNAALFTTAHASNRSLQLTIALSTYKITAEQPVNFGKWVSSSEFVLFHQDTLMHSPYCIPFIPPPTPPLCRSVVVFVKHFFPLLIKNWRLLFYCLLVSLMSFVYV